MKRKTWSLLLVLVLVLSTFLSTSNVSLAASMEGAGTEASPYLIRTVEDLYSIPDKPTAHYKLMNDLDLGNVERAPMAEFFGALNGNGYSIKALNISSSINFTGLFSKITNATVQNLSIVDSTIVAKSSDTGTLCGLATSSKINNCNIIGGSVTGNHRTGGLAGYTTDSSIYQCYSDAKINCSDYAGGIIGVMQNESIMSECFVMCKIDGSSDVGGLIGSSEGSSNITITDCYSISDVTGGSIYGIGFNHSALTIKNCYSVINKISDKNYPLSNGTIVNSYIDKDVSNATTPEDQTRTTAQMYQKSNYEGWDFENVWYIDEGKDYPRLRFAMAEVEPVNELDMVLEVEEKLLLSIDTHLSENINMIWTSSDESVAVVDNKGMVTAVAPGAVTITATAKNGKYTEKINILVVDEADDYRLAVDLKVGESCRATVDKNQHKDGITWSAMDESVATVSSKGKITAQGAGLTLVTATNEEGKVVGEVYIRVRQ